jgi:fructosamine-3-kinase
MIYKSLQLLLEFLRLKSKTQTGRNVIKIGKYVLKIHNNVTEATYEYSILSQINYTNPITFKAPDVFKLLKTQSHGVIVMKYIVGYDLYSYIMRFLLFGTSDVIKTFYKLGKAVRALHSIDFKGLRSNSLPSTSAELMSEIVKLSEKLALWRLIDRELFNAIINIVKEIELADEIFLPVSLHGELYFTHMLVPDSKFVLFDFHNAQRGPLYFDLAMFCISLYVSLIFSFSAQRLIPLMEAFLRGYFGKDLNARFMRSLKIAELYVALREMLTYVRDLYVENSLLTRLIIMLRIKRLKLAIKRLFYQN